jgi:hypothetical protein
MSVVLLIAATHLVFSAGIGVALSAAYPHRIFDIRRWPGGLSPGTVSEMVSAFLGGRANAVAHNGTVFYGSSFAYGYPWQETVIMSSRYAALRPGETVLNVSVIGANLALLDNGILCGARNAGIRTRNAVIELPVVNSTAALVSERANGSAPPPPCDTTLGRESYTAFIARHPLGFGWVPFIWDDKAYPKADEELVLNKVAPGYFTSSERFKEVESDYRAQVASVVRAGQAVADHVFVFPSPVFLPGAAEMGEDADAIRSQLRAAVDACQTLAGVVCLDPELFYARRDLFYNMTHLNQRGHQVMADWLASVIPR